MTVVPKIFQFVLRHICPDVLLDPVNNILRRSAGFYNENRTRQKRQAWGQIRRNDSTFYPQQGLQPATSLGQSYFQPQQQPIGGYPAAPTAYGSNNQLYNSASAMGSWNQSMSRTPVHRQGSWNNAGGFTPAGGPQSCRSMTGERITVQSLGGTQSAG